MNGMYQLPPRHDPWLGHARRGVLACLLASATLVPTRADNATPPGRYQSRLIHLYYFRDVERIAQIINRNVRRGDGKETEERRQRIAQLRQSVDDAAGQRRAAEERARTLIKQAEAQQNANQGSLVSPGGKVVVASPDVLAALDQAKRLGGEEERYRSELFALQAEPTDARDDPYILGETSATDPVGQVTVNVVGEGQIHLRGPVAGVNKITRMVQAIDKPVGQVKIGIHSIQLNMDDQDRVDDVHELIERHVAHARFLSFQSVLLFRQAVAQVVGEVLEAHERGDEPNGFFCGGFMREMRKLGAETGIFDRQLASHGTLNTLNLVSALYITSLAEDSVRQRILADFLKRAGERLPVHELEYCRSLRAERWRERLVTGVMLGRYHRRPQNLTDDQIMAEARRRFAFKQLGHLLDAQQSGPGNFNGVQAATIQLVLGLKRLGVAELELENHELEKSLLPRASLETKLRPVDSDLLDRFVDDQESRVVDLRESLRAAVASVDAQLKQMALAFEEDILEQFHKPAFQDVRRAARFCDVSLGQFETTTILTNDRAISRVNPGQTVQLDLPKRRTLLGEGLSAAEALADESGALAARLGAQAASSAAGAGAAVGALATGSDRAGRLEGLIPASDLFSIETGGQIEVTPVIQPDGESIAYRFVYAYTSDVGDGGDPTERQLSRVKRHYLKTEVQSTSFELREISRFRLALAANRRGRGIPLLGDLPVVGFLARPLASSAAAFQENIILADCVVYPTIFNLIGPDWLGPPVRESNPESLRLVEQRELDRRERIRLHLLQTTEKEADAIVGLPSGDSSTVADESRGKAAPLPVMPAKEPDGKPEKAPERTAESGAGRVRRASHQVPAPAPRAPARPAWRKKSP